ncbi:hypothetical protein B0T24DRAFT_725050 [Lasiosphaeria ovina]|uniref:Uncharacterized protein n=1 Tax=Lasiosphaeria ovina TaxID=92902 RepID=A0AAE0MY68_9PEZI|nr:hypothetical protein B0T24DRAFT_725050 [Lasiosphaeria ovina]
MIVFVRLGESQLALDSWSTTTLCLLSTKEPVNQVSLAVRFIQVQERSITLAIMPSAVPQNDVYPPSTSGTFVNHTHTQQRIPAPVTIYTQQICLDQAVLPGPDRNLPGSTPRAFSDDAGTALTTGIDSQPFVVQPRIVTYPSRFVDKLSDVTNAMKISGSLFIKTATVGGKANGSYIDSDKFKAGDINYHLQKVEKHQFAEVYGGCFISGEESGELNAIISIRVHDKAKVFEIKAAGRIWHGEEQPRQEHRDEPASTRARLLDSYMDYKSMWKEISHATLELKGNRATVELARPGEETTRLALALATSDCNVYDSKGDDATAQPFNALDWIDVGWSMHSIGFASAGGMLTGLRVLYANGREVTHGTYDNEVWRCDVRSDLVFIRADSDGSPSPWPLQVSTLRYLGEGADRVPHDVAEAVERGPRFGGNARWAIRGFYGEHGNGIISRLGVVWGSG